MMRQPITYLILFMLSLLVLSGCSTTPPQSADFCQAKQQPLWLDPAYTEASAYTAVGEGKHFEAAKNQAVVSLSETLQSTVFKQTHSQIKQSGSHNAESTHSVTQNISTQLELSNYAIERYQQSNCQWMVLVRLSKQQAQRLLLHNQSESLYKTAQNPTVSLKKRYASIKEIQKLSQQINYESINLSPELYLDRYQTLYESLTAEVQRNHRYLRLYFRNRSIQQKMPTEIQHQLLDTINVWNAHSPDLPACESLEACLNEAQENQVGELFLVQVDGLIITGLQSTIRKASLSVSLRFYEGEPFALEHQPLLMESYVLTRLKSDINWDILIQRLLQKNRLKLNAFHR